MTAIAGREAERAADRFVNNPVPPTGSIKKPPGRTRTLPGGHCIRSLRSYYFSSSSTTLKTSIRGLSVKVAIRFE